MRPPSIFQILITFVATFACAPLLVAQEADVAKQPSIELLQKDNELLKTKLELLERMLADLQEENDALKKELAAPKQRPVKVQKKTLSDLLPAATVIRGDATSVGKQQIVKADFVLTIVNRNGKKFVGTYEVAGGGLKVDVEGEIIGDKIGFYSVNTSRRIKFFGGRKDNLLNLDFNNELNDHFLLTAKLQ